MKRTEILEIIVGNPQAIFKNANREAGKYSEYPTYFQVIKPANDKSWVYVKSIGIKTNEVVLDAEGNYARDEEGRVIMDTRPLSERATIEQGKFQSIPTRLVLKTDITEASFLADYIAKEEAVQQERAERETRLEKAGVEVKELKELLVALGLRDTGGSNENSLSWYGRITLQFDCENITRLVSVLKSALVEVGV